MKIYLIRHGETDFNRQKLFYGLTDVPINQTGVEQSLLLRKKLTGLPNNYPIYTSELKRTQQTAELIFPEHRQQAKKFLNEKSFGEWEGKNADTIQLNYPKEWRKWLKSPFENTPPGAENFFDFKERVLGGFQDLLIHEESLVIVAHMGVLRVILHGCFPERIFWNIDLDQGNYTCIRYEKKQLTILKWNQ